SHRRLPPSLARDILRVGPEGLGVMTAARQVGGLVGIALTSTLGAARSLGPLFLTVLMAFGASLVSLGLAGTFVVVVLILVCANALGAVTDVLAQTLIQLTVPSDRRGRAGGAWGAAIGLGGRHRHGAARPVSDRRARVALRRRRRARVERPRADGRRRRRGAPGAEAPQALMATPERLVAIDAARTAGRLLHRELRAAHR